MSGPKGINLVYIDTSLLSNEEICASGLYTFSRIYSVLERIYSKCATLKLSPDRMPIMPEQIEGEIRAMLAAGNHRAAAERISILVRLIITQLNQAEDLYTLRLSEIKGRFRQLGVDQKEILLWAERVQSFIKTSLPTDGSQEIRKKIQETLVDTLSQVKSIQIIEEDMTPSGIERLEAQESVSLHCKKMLSEMEQMINDGHASYLSGKLMPGQEKVTKLAELISQMNPRKDKQSQEAKQSEHNTFERLDRLFGKISVLEGTFQWGEIEAKAAAIRLEKDEHRQRGLYESLVIECSQILNKMKETRRFREVIDEMTDRLALFQESLEVREFILELDSLKRVGQVRDLDSYQTKLESLLQSQRERVEREEKRKAILTALNDLGYEAGEDMQTAMVEGGRLVFHKGGNDEYGIEIVATKDFSTIQTEMIRYAATSEITEMQRIRDKEHEESWCSEHASIRKSLEQKGFKSEFILKLEPGEHPVRVEISQELKKQDRQKKRNSQSESSRKQSFEN